MSLLWPVNHLSWLHVFVVAEDSSAGECVWEESRVRGDGAASKGQFRIVTLINKTDFLWRDRESQT